MAKKKNIKESNRQHHAVVEVKSRAYGHHTRAARGSIKPVSLNKVLHANTIKVAAINIVAREVHTAFKLYAGAFKEGMLWQQLLSHMHKAAVVEPLALLNSITGMELNRKYPLRRFGNPPFVTTQLTAGTLHTEMNNNQHPDIKQAGDTYAYDMLVLLLNKKGKAVAQETLQSEWLYKTAALTKLSFAVELPKPAAFMCYACGCILAKTERLLIFLPHKVLA